MSLEVIGAGLGRTGTTSLKLALEKLLSGSCYHMANASRPDHIASWHAAAQQDYPDWGKLFQGYTAVTDWPAAAFYKQLMQAYPEAKIVLSYRDPEAWYHSCQNTIFPKIKQVQGEWGDMIRAVVFGSFISDLDNKQACIEAYLTHLEQVRSDVPKDRLIEWQTGDGWQPLCDGLGIEVPNEPFPHVNTTSDFQQRAKS